MAAVAWERFDEQVARGSWRDPAPAPSPLRLVTAPPSRRRPSVVVHRRRQLVALALVVVAVLAIGAGVRALTSSVSAGDASAPAREIVAEPGDSYWSLASELDRGGDLRSTVDALVDANGGRDLRAGDRIAVGG
jgi:hypothetical protein